MKQTKKFPKGYKMTRKDKNVENITDQELEIVLKGYKI